MKYYQDTITGQIYAFENHVNVEKLMQTNRNIPKTLIDKVKEKPSNNHIWYNGDWIHEKNKPIAYKEPISKIPSYDPAWITFLFEPLIIISKSKDDFVVSLNDINTNLYDTRILSKFIAKLKNYDENSQLDILVTFDGSIMLPIDENYNTPEKAVNKFNEIIGALFLGGILVKPIDLIKLQQGCIIENGGSNFSYTPSPNNDFRNKSASITERIKAHHPNHIQVEEFVEAYNFGITIIYKINFSPIFLALGYHYLNQGKIAESLSNLWIVIEQLTDFLYTAKIDSSILKILKRALPKNINIKTKHDILHETKIINEQIFQVLKCNREDRNNLLHNGIIPNRKNVLQLWTTLLELLEVATSTKIEKLQKNSKIILNRNLENHIKNVTPKKTNFEQWKKDEESLPYL
ncbi:hypothetical protein [Arcobacter ellisii]|uniref:Apea-like HEPN domain-containing protein n=1 Tax=Arcobacter ellisii TaxID=913109 RepID=A0A347U7D1_9BACT|nr:hypothetical protein [Arcobacter ellisii]AXX94759.1 hypothetical protein AELL_1089 [Arcobacter ellisii]RXI30641.1 hypothetical protein CP962_07690 [Arcobacter ellisii]